MAFRREALEAVGGFDDELGAGGTFRSGEDVDMFLRCMHNGWEGRYEPAATVVHEQWRDGLDSLKLRFGYGLGNGAYRVKAIRLGIPDAGRYFLRSLARGGSASTTPPALAAARPWRARSSGWRGRSSERCARCACRCVVSASRPRARDHRLRARRRAGARHPPG